MVYSHIDVSRKNKIFYSDEDERALLLLQVNLFQYLKYLKNIFSIFLPVLLVLLEMCRHKYVHIFCYIVDVFYAKNVRMYHIFHITLTLLIVQGKNFLSTPYSDYTARADLTGKELLTLNNIHPLTVDFVASFFSSTNQPFTHTIHFISIHSCMCILHTRIRRDSSVGKMKFKMAFLLFISYCALHKFLHTIFVCYTICLESRKTEEHQESKAQGKYIHSLWYTFFSHGRGTSAVSRSNSTD